MTLPPLQIRWLGRIRYHEALALQEELVAAKVAGDPTNHLLLLEHEPVYTIGRTRDRASLGSGPLPHPVVETGRGGQGTYHGPGQLVGYFLFDLQALRPDLHFFLRWVEEGLITLLDGWGLKASRREGLTGVWVGDRKIASIGIGVRRWITMHGFALNILPDLTPFTAITPCGIAGVTMTSVHLEHGPRVSVEETAVCAGEAFRRILPQLAAPAPPSA